MEPLPSLSSLFRCTIRCRPSSTPVEPPFELCYGRHIFTLYHDHRQRATSVFVSSFFVWVVSTHALYVAYLSFPACLPIYHHSCLSHVVRPTPSPSCGRIVLSGRLSSPITLYDFGRPPVPCSPRLRALVATEALVYLPWVPTARGAVSDADYPLPLPIAQLLNDVS